ncbi:hypothetical protein EJB05_25671, partial [Eragrostis curvula]
MSTYHYTSGNSQQLHVSALSWQYTAAIVVVLGLAVVAIVVKLTCSCLRALKPQHNAGGDGGGRAPTSVLARGDSGGGDRPPPQEQQPPAPSTVAVEMVRSVGPLVCTYRRADGWREAACGVCLSELADGEAVRVLPACMHYFHTACVGEWLRERATCPLCRAPLAPPPAAAASE